MSLDEAARILASAITGTAARHAGAVRTQAWSGTVAEVDPTLQIDLHGSDLTLDDGDVTVPTGVELEPGDVVTLNEIAEGEFHLVAVQGQ